jgi:hypothetical protein
VNEVAVSTEVAGGIGSSVEVRVDCSRGRVVDVGAGGGAVSVTAGEGIAVGVLIGVAAAATVAERADRAVGDAGGVAGAYLLPISNVPQADISNKQAASNSGLNIRRGFIVSS